MAHLKFWVAHLGASAGPSPADNGLSQAPHHGQTREAAPR